MSRKTVIIGIAGLLASLILLFPSTARAAQYYLQYIGNSFQPKTDSLSFMKGGEGYLYHNDTSDASYFCPVNFSVPDGSVHFIKSIGMRYRDGLPDAHLYVELLRRNLYTGSWHTVASWQSNHEGSSSSILTASKATNTGYKLADIKKFSYWLHVAFIRDGEANPSSDLMLYQVRVHYGT